jgi:L-alanine-DL-glutamate epimerase-like enolase superfamily enzyme
MKLSRWSLHAYVLPYARPVRWAGVVEAGAEFLLLRLESAEGAVGIAELTAKPTWNGVTIRSLTAAVEDVMMPLVATSDLADPAQVRATLDSVPDNHAAKTLVDNACWDLHAAALGTPLWRAWGGRGRLPLSWAVTRQAPALMAKEAEDMVARHGFRTLKVKGGQGLETDMAGMRAIRAAVGDAVTLYVDANGFYAPNPGRDYARAMAEAGAVVVEDPCPFAPDAEFRALQDGVPVPILVDFYCGGRVDATRYIAQGARGLSLKPGRWGLSETRAMQLLARAAGLRTAIGLFGESALGTYSALQLGSILPESALAAETSWYLAMTEQVTAMPVLREGAIDLPEAASLAALVDWDAVKRFAI